MIQIKKMKTHTKHQDLRISCNYYTWISPQFAPPCTDPGHMLRDVGERRWEGSIGTIISQEFSQRRVEVV